MPVEWGWDKNVRWKTPVVGSGAASPIVWRDQVFLANAYAGEERHPWHRAIAAVITILCVIAAWTFLDGTFGDPRGDDVREGASTAPRRGRFGKLALLALFFAVGYATIIASEWTIERLKGIAIGDRIVAKLFDKAWLFCPLTDAAQSEDVRAPISALNMFRDWSPNQGRMFVGAPRIPKACFYAGVLGLAAVFAVNRWLRRRTGAATSATEPETIDRRRHFALRVDLLGMTVRLALQARQSVAAFISRAAGLLGAVVAACFVIALQSAVMADLPYQPRGETWYLSGCLLVLGLIAGVLWLPDRLSIRLVGLAIAGLALIYVLAEAPADHVNKASVALNRAEFPRWMKYLVMAAPIALLAGFAGGRRGYFGPCTGRAPFRPAALAGALAMMLAAFLYFYSANWLLPGNAYVREVIAFDRETGQVQWATHCFADESSRELHPANTMASPSPVTDGERVYAQFGEAGLFCLDMQGNLLWRFAEPARPSHWGAGSSPILCNDLVIATFDTDETSLTIALDKRTGDEKWRSDRKPQITPSQKYDSYTTPIVITRGDKQELVHHTCKLLAAYDPTDGRELWSLAHPGEQPIATPVTSDDLIIVLGGTYARYLGAIRVDASSEKETASEAWQSSSSQPDLCSPVVYDGLVYLVTTGGVASCLDAQTGKSLWKHRLGGAFWASVTAGDGKVYFTNADGQTTVVEAGPKYKELAVNELGQEVQASFAISQGGIFIRTRDYLVQVGASNENASEETATQSGAGVIPTSQSRASAGLATDRE